MRDQFRLAPAVEPISYSKRAPHHDCQLQDLFLGGTLALNILIPWTKVLALQVPMTNSHYFPYR